MSEDLNTRGKIAKRESVVGTILKAVGVRVRKCKCK